MDQLAVPHALLDSSHLPLDLLCVPDAPLVNTAALPTTLVLIAPQDSSTPRPTSAPVLSAPPEPSPQSPAQLAVLPAPQEAPSVTHQPLVPPVPLVSTNKAASAYSAPPEPSPLETALNVLPASTEPSPQKPDQDNVLSAPLVTLSTLMPHPVLLALVVLMKLLVSVTLVLPEPTLPLVPLTVPHAPTVPTTPLLTPHSA